MELQPICFAFTLAEVLITLGIIGVVAALTMPNLIANYQKQLWITQLKKQINVINNNLIRIKADEGVDNLYDSSFVIGKTNEALDIDSNKYREYFSLAVAPKGSKIQKLFNSIGEDINEILITNDGAYLVFVHGDHPYVMLDINGDKMPNRGGRDRFIFYIFNKGVEHMSLDTDENRQNCINMVKVTSSPDYSPDEFNAIQFSPYGAANVCFTKIMHDGWQMNY